MANQLKLQPVVAVESTDLAAIRDALSTQLLGGATDRRFAFSVEEDDGAYGAPAWTEPGSGDVHVSRATAEGLDAGDLDAVRAVAHELVHSIGYGPAFARLEEQLLEEAITETLAQCYIAPIAAAFGVDVEAPPPLFAYVANGADVEVARVTAANVSVERFGRIAAWLEGYDDGEAEADELEAAALKWALRLKATPGDKRFEVLAEEAAALDKGDAGDDIDATDVLEEYLRGYMKQLARSVTGFAGLRYAAARAWGDAATPAPALGEPAPATWRTEIEIAEAVTLMPMPPRGALDRALSSAPAEIAAAARRSLDARLMMWAARNLDASRIEATK